MCNYSDKQSPVGDTTIPYPPTPKKHYLLLEKQPSRRLPHFLRRATATISLDFQAASMFQRLISHAPNAAGRASPSGLRTHLTGAKTPEEAQRLISHTSNDGGHGGCHGSMPQVRSQERHKHLCEQLIRVSFGAQCSNQSFALDATSHSAAWPKKRRSPGTQTYEVKASIPGEPSGPSDQIQAAKKGAGPRSASQEAEPRNDTSA